MKGNAPMKADPKGGKRLLLDLFNYAQDGMQQGGFFFQFIGIASSVFVALHITDLLPGVSYLEFFLVLVVLGMPALAGFGYWFQRMSQVYARGLVISTESNPYSNWKMTKRDLPLWTSAALVLKDSQLPEAQKQYEAVAEMLERNGVTL